MSPPETQPTMPDVRLERYRLGELPPEERQAMAARIAADPELQRRLLRLAESDREIAAAFPATEMAAQIRRRGVSGAASPAAPRPRRWLVPATAAATCVLLTAVAASIWIRQPRIEQTTIKSSGEPSLTLHRRVPDGSEELRRGAVARQGDLVRIGYRSSGRAYGAILSLDGRGTLTQHLPRSGDLAAPLAPKGTIFLDFAYELDDAPRWETFLLVTSDTPFDLELVRRAVREAGASRSGEPTGLVLPRRFQHDVFTLTKASR